jgi:hypothetical protein
MAQKLVTVGELIGHLQKLDPSLPIGRVGHFGEFHPMDLGDFWASRAYTTPSGLWRDEDRTNLDVLAIHPPDIGDEPD